MGKYVLILVILGLIFGFQVAFSIFGGVWYCILVAGFVSLSLMTISIVVEAVKEPVKILRHDKITQAIGFGCAAALLGWILSICS